MPYLGWADPTTIKIGAGKGRPYTTPDGVFRSTTTFLKVLGLKTDPLMDWAAKQERAACLEAATEIFMETLDGRVIDNPTDFHREVEGRLGKARSHQIQKTKAADIGTSIHQSIHAMLANQLDGGCRPVPTLCDEAQWAIMSFEDWWKQSGLKAVRMEQPVWDPEIGYAGTIDLVAEHPTTGLGVIDFKTSKAVYDDHHIQVAAYLHAGNRFAPLHWAEIVRLPKVVSDPRFEVVPLGAMYRRQLTREQLMKAFTAAVQAYEVLVGD